MVISSEGPSRSPWVVLLEVGPGHDGQVERRGAQDDANVATALAHHGRHRVQLFLEALGHLERVRAQDSRAPMETKNAKLEIWGKRLKNTIKGEYNLKTRA